MFLHRSGDVARPTVVLIHGIPGSAAAWSDVAASLATEHHVVVPDLLGFGNSPRPDKIDAPDQAAALDEALAAAGIERAIFVGHDFGGPISLSLYRARPELFGGLCLMATNAFPDTPIPFPLNLVTAPLVGRVAARALFSAPALRQMVRRYGGAHLGDPGSVRRIFTRALQNLDEMYRDYPEVLRSLSIPTLVLWGEKDPFFPVAQGERTAALLADGAFEILPDAGHFLPEQRPRDVAAAVAGLAARASGDVRRHG